MHYLFFFLVEILAMKLDISCSLVLVFILPVAERGQISHLAVKIITSACVVCLNVGACGLEASRC